MVRVEEYRNRSMRVAPLSSFDRDLKIVVVRCVGGIDVFVRCDDGRNALR